MKRLTIIILTLLITIVATAQDQRPAPQKFSPEKFQADLEQFITKEACLTSKEAAQFFPVYKEMQAKLRAVFDQQRQLGKVKPGDEKGCEKAIRQRDEYDLELKRIQQSYHKKFLDILPASKVYDIIQAEDKFHRHKLKQWSHQRRQ